MYARIYYLSKSMCYLDRGGMGASKRVFLAFCAFASRVCLVGETRLPDEHIWLQSRLDKKITGD